MYGWSASGSEGRRAAPTEADAFHTSSLDKGARVTSSAESQDRNVSPASEGVTFFARPLDAGEVLGDHWEKVTPLFLSATLAVAGEVDLFAKKRPARTRIPIRKTRNRSDSAKRGGTSMPNKRSAEKRLRQSLKRRQRNLLIKADLRIRVKQLERAIKNGEPLEKVHELYNLAAKRLEMAASKGVIHRNKAARKKSRLMAKVNAYAASLAQAGGSAEEA
ncbi:MAG: 30S ribosomal protein S20 [Brockia lithotrophica]|nr:30S ribosomal protein S20 [Brockia lithotrophica]